ncbi:MAG TPA: 30S ribosome-binding factor RbfA [Gemmatimonadota bacterium]|nr:30S ribosome-binding factor RbfA [Gemmatimonadota bacterium]
MAPRNRRMRRLDELLRQEIARLILEEVRDPRVGFTTVMDARVSPDLRHARVYVSVLGDDAEKEAAVEALRRARWFLRGRLGSIVEMRYLPELEFELDRSLERASRIEEILDRVRPPSDPEDEPPGKGS